MDRLLGMGTGRRSAVRLREPECRRPQPGACVGPGGRQCDDRSWWRRETRGRGPGDRDGPGRRGGRGGRDRARARGPAARDHPPLAAGHPCALLFLGALSTSHGQAARDRDQHGHAEAGAVRMAVLARSARQCGVAFRPVRRPLWWGGSAGRGGMASVLHPMCSVMAQTAIRSPVEAHVRVRCRSMHGGNGHRGRGVCGWHLRQRDARDQRDEPRDEAGPLHGLRLSSAVATNDDVAGFMVLHRIHPVGVGPGGRESSPVGSTTVAFGTVILGSATSCAMPVVPAADRGPRDRARPLPDQAAE